MKHLSIRTTELPAEVVREFHCPYEMGDEFVETIAEVDCPYCLTQIKDLEPLHPQLWAGKP